MSKRSRARTSPGLHLEALELRVVPSRGRPTLNDARTTFVGDNGQLLRGPFTSTEWTPAVPESDLALLKNLGFNSVHLYAEVFDARYPNQGSTAPGARAAYVDQIVQETQDLGLYLVITIGNGANNGNYNRRFVEDFWRFYAPRYANDTNVLYEIQNEPVAWGPPYSSPNAHPPGAVDMEESAYNIIRTYAPQTPVLLFSYSVFGGTGAGNAALQDIHAFNQAAFGDPNAVWTNEAVAFHGYAGAASTPSAVQTLLNAGYPAFMTEFAGPPDWGTHDGGLDVDMTAALERMQVSWLTFQHVPPWGVSGDVTDPSQFQDKVNRSGLGWTPDYGTWPAARAPYGNNGFPWYTTSTFINNQLTGTLHLAAVNFDAGGEGVAYHDTTPGDYGGDYRPGENVDIIPATDTGGGYAIGSTAGGEWFQYTVDVPEPGYFSLGLRYANTTSGAAVRVSAQGLDLTGPLTLPTTGSLDSWSTLTSQVFLGYGQQILRLDIPAGGFRLNWMELTPSPTGPVANGTYLLVDRNSGLAMQLDTAHNTVLQQPPASGSTLQKWNLQSLGAGQYKVTSAYNGNSWTTGGNPGDALNLTGSWSVNNKQQRFLVRPIGDGYDRITPVNSGLDFNVQNSSTTAGAPVVQSIYAGLASQEWGVLTPSDQVFPTGLVASRDGTGNAQLSWHAAPGASSYNVKRAATPGGPYTTIATDVTGTSYLDTSAPGNTASYVVSAVSAGGSESLNSVEASVLPKGVSDADIGGPGQRGSASFNPAAGTWTVAGGGADIWNTSDQFHFVSQAFTGDGSLTARVLSVQNTDQWAKAGVMFRDSADPRAVFADAMATPGNGVAFQWRSNYGAVPSNVNVAGLPAPVWLRLARAGNTFSASYSTDGVTWTRLGATQTVVMSPTALAGLAVTAHNNSALCTATFTNVSVLPAGWSDADLGGPGQPGYADFRPATGTWAVAGGGADIWNASDQFHFVSQGFTGDGTASAHVLSVQNTDPWAKAGVMFRDSADPAAPEVAVVATPGNGVSFQWRSTPAGLSSFVNVPGLHAPVWVQLVRAGNTFSASYSTDGNAWTPLGSPQTVVMNATALVGLAVTAHNNAALTTATFDDLSLTGPPDLAHAFNQIGIYDDTYAFSSSLLGSAVDGNGITFTLGASGVNDVVRAAGTLIPAPGLLASQCAGRFDGPVQAGHWKKLVWLSAVDLMTTVDSTPLGADNDSTLVGLTSPSSVD